MISSLVGSHCLDSRELSQIQNLGPSLLSVHFPSLLMYTDVQLSGFKFCPVFQTLQKRQQNAKDYGYKKRMQNKMESEAPDYLTKYPYCYFFEQILIVFSIFNVLVSNNGFEASWLRQKNA